MFFSRVIADVYESWVPFNRYELPEGNSKVQLVSFETELHLWTSCSLFHTLPQTSSTLISVFRFFIDDELHWIIEQVRSDSIAEESFTTDFSFFVAKIIGAAVEDISLWFSMLIICSPSSWCLLPFDVDSKDIKRTAETRFSAVDQVDFQCDARNRML